MIDLPYPPYDIICMKQVRDWTAFINGSEICEFGDTKEEAVAKLITAYSHLFGIRSIETQDSPYWQETKADGK